jgi:hypothetical protein
LSMYIQAGAVCRHNGEHGSGPVPGGNVHSTKPGVQGRSYEVRFSVGDSSATQKARAFELLRHA